VRECSHTRAHRRAKFINSGGGAELVAGVLGQQHHPDVVQMSREGSQQSQQPGGGEHRHVVHVELTSGDAHVVDTQQRQHRRPQRAGEPLGLPADGGDGLVEGVAIVPGGPSMA
jgi:hypothetical protein